MTYTNLYSVCTLALSLLLSKIIIIRCFHECRVSFTLYLLFKLKLTSNKNRTTKLNLKLSWLLGYLFMQLFFRENRKESHAPFVKTYATLGYLWGFRVPGSGFRVPGSGFESWSGLGAVCNQNDLISQERIMCALTSNRTQYWSLGKQTNNKCNNVKFARGRRSECKQYHKCASVYVNECCFETRKTQKSTEDKEDGFPAWGNLAILVIKKIYRLPLTKDNILLPQTKRVLLSNTAETF